MESNERRVMQVETWCRRITSHLFSSTNALCNTFRALMHVFTFPLRRKAQHDGSARVWGWGKGGLTGSRSSDWRRERFFSLSDRFP